MHPRPLFRSLLSPFSASPFASLSQIARKGRFLALCGVAVLAVALGGLGGCDAYQARQDVKAQLTELQAERDDLARQASQLQAIERTTAAQAKAVAERESIIRQSIAQVSAQLAQATGPAFDALSQTLASLQNQLKAASDQTAAANKQAAQAAGLSSRIASEIAAVDASLEQGQFRLDAIDKAIAEKTSGLGGMIRSAGDIVQNYGVPGAAPIAGTAADFLTGVVGLLLGGVGAGVVAKKKLNAAKDEAETASKAASEIAESIQSARNNVPGFEAAFQQASGVLADYQGEEALAVIAKAKAAIPTKGTFDPALNRQM